MVKDYHMHPTVVSNPFRFAQFARTAIERGINEICITDHMPLSVSRAGDRIPAGRVEEYCAAVRRLSAVWEGRLTVKLGIEVDFHPSFLDEIQAVLKAGNFDYVIGASHLHVVECNVFSTAHTRNEFARAMLENTLACARSGYFDAIAHIDFYRWHFTLPDRFPLIDDDYCFEKHLPLLETVLDAIRDEGLLLEINPHLAVIQNQLESTYPEPVIIQMALDRGLRFSYGSDAHAAEHVGAKLCELRAHPVYGQALRTWEES